MKNKTKTIALFGGSFNPPGLHHRKIVEALALQFDVVKVIVCGPRPDKESTNGLKPVHRAVMSDITFQDIAPNVEVELFDLENQTYTHTCDLETKYKTEGDVWHVVGTDLVRGGGEGKSEIHTWHNGRDLWKNARFAVVMRGNDNIEKDLPPHHITITIDKNNGSSTEIRNKIFNYASSNGLVTPRVEEYMQRRNLYKGAAEVRVSKLVIKEPRLLIVKDSTNPRARSVTKQLASLEDKKNPNIIVTVGGDGTMLRAIKEHWRKRLPFFGINVGHAGFLLNNVADQITKKLLLQEFVVRHSPMLIVSVVYKNGETKRFSAFNDAFVHAKPGRAGWFEVRVNNKTRMNKLVADGVLVATPTGSTAYASAMGANPIPMGVDMLVVVGSNVFNPVAWNKGANISIDSEVTFTNADKSRVRKMYGFIDGEATGEIEEMKIRVSRIAAAEVLFTKKNDIQAKLDRLQFP